MVQPYIALWSILASVLASDSSLARSAAIRPPLLAVPLRCLGFCFKQFFGNRSPRVKASVPGDRVCSSSSLLGSQTRPALRLPGKMAITRAVGRSVIRNLALGLPEDCWIAVIARLDSSDICRAICTCRAFALMSEDIWRAACELRWPGWAALANVPGVAWRRQFELLSLREREAGIIPDVAVIAQTQSLVKPYHRAVLTEWLAEVRPSLCSTSHRTDAHESGGGSVGPGGSHLSSQSYQAASPARQT